MKKNILLALASLFTLSIFAQKSDTVYLGAGITNQAYYSLLNGVQKNTANDDWDIAFQIGNVIETSIMINPANGTELYVYPGTVGDWSTLTDTAGLGNWTQQFNADTSWDFGAFSNNKSGFNVGWGEYNQTTHEINGDKIFIIKLSNGVYQKIMIESLIGGVYTFRHATLNNSMDMTHTIKKADFTGRNFAYFSLQTHSQLDKEPELNEWDLYFGKYTGFVPSPYVLTGVLQNVNTEASKAYPINDVSSYANWNAHSLSFTINQIGFDWKFYDFQNNTYSIEDSTVYFVRTQLGDVFKIVFTDYGYDASQMKATGAIAFNTQQVHFSGIEDEKDLDLFNVYPNPADNALNIAYMSSSDAVVEVIDLQGKTHLFDRISSNSITHQMDVSNLDAGLYMLVISSEKNRISKKLIIQ